MIDRHTVAHVAKVFAEKGSDSWWAEPLEMLLPPDVLKKVNNSCKYKVCVLGRQQANSFMCVFRVKPAL